jgi:Yip1 domain
MNIVARVKNIILTPKTEWDVIAAEPTQPKDLTISYVLPLAALAAIAGFIGIVVIGSFLVGRVSFVWGLVGLVWHLVMAVVSVFVIGFIIDALAPSFGGQKNFNQAFKVAAYAATPKFVGALFTIIPFLGGLVYILFALYGLYVLYLGLPRLMKNPEDKTIVYELVIVVVAVVFYVFVGVVGGMMTGGAMLGAAAMGAHTSLPARTYDRDSAMGKLDAFSKKMEEAGKRMEAAQKSGDPNKQMEAAMATLGTAMSGGKGVDPVQIDALKPFVPDSFAGLPRTDLRTERSGVAGLMTAKAEGVYNNQSGKNASLEVVDTGGVAGLMGLASWMNVQGERENADRREATRKDGARLVHEEESKRGGSNKYTVVLNDRFVVEARGNVDFGQLKSAVNGLDLAKIESLK